MDKFPLSESAGKDSDQDNAKDSECVLEMLTSDYLYSECTNPAQIYTKVTSISSHVV